MAPKRKPTFGSSARQKKPKNTFEDVYSAPTTPPSPTITTPSTEWIIEDGTFSRSNYGISTPSSPSSSTADLPGTADYSIDYDPAIFDPMTFDVSDKGDLDEDSEDDAPVCCPHHRW
jgi:hypothetical protein